MAGAGSMSRLALMFGNGSTSTFTLAPMAEPSAPLTCHWLLLHSTTWPTSWVGLLLVVRGTCCTMGAARRCAWLWAARQHRLRLALLG